MTPDERITQLENTVAQLVTFINSLGDMSTIPLEIGTSFKERLGSLQSSTNAISSKTVNEGGVQSYTVAKAYDRMIRTTVDGRITYIGVYNS
jgi:hypothetical protein